MDGAAGNKVAVVVVLEIERNFRNTTQELDPARCIPPNLPREMGRKGRSRLVLRDGRIFCCFAEIGKC